MNECFKPINAELDLKNVYFENISYKFDFSKHTPEIEHEIFFTRTISKINDESYDVSLEINISDSSDCISLQMRVTGQFTCKVKDKEAKDYMINVNAVAILFPYLRSQICMVTTQPNILPINLPPMNVAVMFSDEKEDDE